MSLRCLLLPENRGRCLRSVVAIGTIYVAASNVPKVAELESITATIAPDMVVSTVVLLATLALVVAVATTVPQSRLYNGFSSRVRFGLIGVGIVMAVALLLWIDPSFRVVIQKTPMSRTSPSSVVPRNLAELTKPLQVRRNASGCVRCAQSNPAPCSSDGVDALHCRTCLWRTK